MIPVNNHFCPGDRSVLVIMIQMSRKCMLSNTSMSFCHELEYHNDCILTIVIIDPC